MARELLAAAAVSDEADVEVLASYLHVSLPARPNTGKGRMAPGNRYQAGSVRQRTWSPCTWGCWLVFCGASLMLLETTRGATARRCLVRAGVVVNRCTHICLLMVVATSVKCSLACITILSRVKCQLTSLLPLHLQP